MSDADPYPDPDALACIELVELVTEYLDGALETSKRARLEAHLASCAGCTAYVEQVRATIAIAGRLEPDAVPPDALDRIVAAYREFRSGSGGT